MESSTERTGALCRCAACKPGMEFPSSLNNFFSGVFAIKSKGKVNVMLTRTAIVCRRHPSATNTATRRQPPNIAPDCTEICPRFYWLGIPPGRLRSRRTSTRRREACDGLHLSPGPDQRPDAGSRSGYKVWRGRGRGSGNAVFAPG